MDSPRLTRIVIFGRHDAEEKKKEEAAQAEEEDDAKSVESDQPSTKDSDPSLFHPAIPKEPGARLHYFAVKGDLAAVKEILLNPALTKEQRQKLVDYRDPRNFNRTPLIKASLVGHLPIVEFLVRGMNADLYVRDSHELGSMAIHFAAEWGHLDVVRFLTDYDPDLVEMPNSVDASPLNLAAFAGYFPVVEFLVEEKRAKLENKGSLKRTPLMSAAEQGHLAIVEYLATRCANVMAKSSAESNEDMAIHLASYFGHVKVVELLVGLKPQLVQVTNKTGQTALNLAAMAGQIRVVRFLVDVKKADVEHRGQFGRTPAMQAADAGHVQVVDCLVQNGANLLAVDNENGDTALHLAAYFGQAKVVDFLLGQQGVDWSNCKNKQGQTPLGLAKRQKNSEILELFKLHGVRK